MTRYKRAILIGVSAILLVGAIPAIAQLGSQAGGTVPRAGWVELRDPSNVLRGYIQIVGAGSDAKVLFRDAEQTPIEVQATAPPRAAIAPLALEPIPQGEKADMRDTIELMKAQIAVLDHNVTRLEARVNELR